MNTFCKLKTYICSALVLAIAFTAPLAAVSSAGDKVSDLISSCPWIGLIAKEVSYGPITISNLNIADAGKLAFCEPGEKIEGSLKYKIDAKKLDSWNVHHIIVGLRGQDAQSCITHSIGVWDKKGKANFSFTAPQEKGIYEVCFDYQEAALCCNAIDEWHNHPPAHKATIGILVVE